LAEQENHNLCVRGSNPFAAIIMMHTIDIHCSEVTVITAVSRVKNIFGILHVDYVAIAWVA
jgi:hypothetical protein